MTSLPTTALRRVAAATATAALLAGCGGSSDSDSSEAGALCFDNAVYAPGAVVKANYTQRWGDAIGTYAQTETVTSTNARFQGQTGLVERNTRIDGQILRDGVRNVDFANITRFLRVQSSSVVLYGSVAYPSRSGFPEVTRTFDPPSEDARARLRVGQDLLLRGTGTQTFFGGFTYPVPSAPEPFSTELRVRFDSVEEVSVPAGRYRACRFRVTEDQVERTEWLYRGVVVRSERSTAKPELQVLELQSATLNDAPI